MFLTPYISDEGSLAQAVTSAVFQLLLDLKQLLLGPQQLLGELPGHPQEAVSSKVQADQEEFPL